MSEERGVVHDVLETRVAGDEVYVAPRVCSGGVSDGHELVDGGRGSVSEGEGVKFGVERGAVGWWCGWRHYEEIALVYRSGLRSQIALSLMPMYTTGELGSDQEVN